MKGKLKDPATEDAKTEDDDTSASDDKESSDLDDKESSDSDIEQNLEIHSQSTIDAPICLRCNYLKCLVHLAFSSLSCTNIMPVKLDLNC